MLIFKKRYIKNGTYQKFLKSKFDPNIHQKRTKLHSFKFFFRGGIPPNPASKATCKFPNLKNKLLPPSQILATPLTIYLELFILYRGWSCKTPEWSKSMIISDFLLVKLISGLLEFAIQCQTKYRLKK